MINVDLDISPAQYDSSNDGNHDAVPELTITATLDAQCPKPITVFTWPTFLNPKLALQRKNFQCEDITENKPIKLEVSKGPKRGGYSRNRHSPDAKYYITFQPGQAAVIKYPFWAVARQEMRSEERLFKVGHKFKLTLEDGKDEQDPISQGLWWWGTRDDVLLEGDDETNKDVSNIKGTEPLRVITRPAEFEVV